MDDRHLHVVEVHMDAVTRLTELQKKMDSLEPVWRILGNKSQEMMEKHMELDEPSEPSKKYEYEASIEELGDNAVSTPSPGTKTYIQYLLNEKPITCQVLTVDETKKSLPSENIDNNDILHATALQSRTKIFVGRPPATLSGKFDMVWIEEIRDLEYVE